MTKYKLKPEYAGKVYSPDLGRYIDRTKEKHLVGRFDIDFKLKNPNVAQNPAATEWLYFGTKKSEKEAEKEAMKFLPELAQRFGELNARLVDADTGLVLKKFKIKR